MLSSILQNCLVEVLIILRKLVGSPIKILTREEVEEENIPLKNAEMNDVAFLIAGDPLIATTHSEMLIQAKKNGIINIGHTFFIYYFGCSGNSWSSGI